MFLNVWTKENPPKYRCGIEDPRNTDGPIYKYIMEFTISNDELCDCGADKNCNMNCCPYGYYPIPPEEFVLEAMAIINTISNEVGNEPFNKDTMTFRIDDECSTIRFYSNNDELALMLKMTWNPDCLKHLYCDDQY